MHRAHRGHGAEPFGAGRNAAAGALPFTLFAIFPSWLKSLPRAGGWFNTVKVTLGFIELILALKFLGTANLAYHWYLLARDLYLVLWIALGSLLVLYLLGKLRFAHDGALTHLSVGRALAGAAGLYLVPGLFGAPLPLLASYLPPQSSYDFTVAPALGGTPAPAASATVAPQEILRFAPD